ncbi:V-type proton ATPase proteolipid subunit [Spironucleus salmonicida]|uniref:V-type proton ATPase proteolipid subunit n=1 Tax=Spironucleus salmonicida TaxID=348837 RepID=V6LFL0_9EUKA|nr:V-type proton ATPase proteolipid subunit [Spironucleus salmonicida]|eukprot:EST43330.1 Vacuolar ATP synthase 16 kDa proteolipid subunit [Spironucleus salmonicida]
MTSEIVNQGACPYGSAMFSYLGMGAGVALSSLGSAYGTAKAGKGVIISGIMKPSQAMKATLPVIMAGVLGIYGLIIAIVINSQIVKYEAPPYPVGAIPLLSSHAHLAAGISTGLAAFAAGIAIGISGSAGARANARNPKLFVVMLLILVFGEALALYGLILGLILCFKSVGPETCIIK